MKQRRVHRLFGGRSRVSHLRRHPENPLYCDYDHSFRDLDGACCSACGAIEGRILFVIVRELELSRLMFQVPVYQGTTLRRASYKGPS